MKNKKLGTSNLASSQKDTSDNAESTIATSTESNPSAEQGSKNKPMIRTYYSNKIWYDDNIYIVFLEYNQKTKELIEDSYRIIAAGEKILKEKEEDNSNSYDSCDDNKSEENKEWEELACLEI